MDENYFRHAVAKAIMWRTAEKLFDTLDLDGYRANSVAYGIAWLAEESDHKINLDQIWGRQRITEALGAALKAACAAAHNHISESTGNPGEVSKREVCWKEFRGMKLKVPSAWRSELATNSYIVPRTQDESLKAEWERIRGTLANDSRTLGEIEAYTGKEWIKARRGEPVYTYASMTWDQLKAQKGMGRKVKALIELLSASVR